MTTWFDDATGDGLTRALARLAVDEPNAVVTVTGRGLVGHVWLRDGDVAFAHTEDQPQLRRALQLTGVVDAAGLAALADSADLPVDRRPVVTADVLAVVDEVTETAIARLAALGEGSLRVRGDELPPLGVMRQRPVEEVEAAGRAAAVRAEVARLGTRGAWRPVRRAAEHVTLSPAEWAVVAGMTGPVAAQDLAARVGVPYAQLRAVLATLADRGLLQRLGDAATRPAEAAAPPATQTAPPPPPPARAAVPATSVRPAPVDGPAPAAPPAPPTPPARPVPAMDAASAASALSSLLSATGRAPVPLAPPAPPSDDRVPVGVGSAARHPAPRHPAPPASGRAAALRRLISAVRAG